MSPTAILGAEHDLILDVVRALDRRLDERVPIDPDLWTDAVTFLRSFGTQHHAKENIVLLAALERQGLPASEPSIRATTDEHDEEAVLLESMVKALRDSGSDDRFRQAARAYNAHLLGHIDQETRHLFPLVERVLSPEDQREVMHRFLLYGHAANGEDQYGELLAIADRVRRAP